MRTSLLVRRESQMNPFPTPDALEQLPGAMRTSSLEWREPHTTSLDAAQAVRDPHLLSMWTAENLAKNLPYVARVAEDEDFV